MPGIGTKVFSNNWEQTGYNMGKRFASVLNDRVIPSRRGNGWRGVGNANDPRRDIDRDCGYPSTNLITTEMYQDLYDRSEIAARVVEMMPRECWQVQPRIIDKGIPGKPTAFEKAVSNLPKMLNPESRYRGALGSSLWPYLKRLDIMSGIGQYAVMLLGLDDELPLSEPAVPSDGEPYTLRYLRVFPQRLAEVSKVDTDKTSPRYGMPVSYRVWLTDPKKTDISGISPNVTGTEQVHWSRMIHVCDNPQSSEHLGTPRCQTVYNRILDLYKLYGSSAEMYYLGAFFGLAFETLPEAYLAGAELSDLAKNKNAYENFANGFQRALQVHGQTVKSIAPQVVDPTPQIMAAIQAICVRLNSPVSVFMGKDRDTDDGARWNDQVRSRQLDHCTPIILAQFFDRLIHLGVIPDTEEEEGYTAAWPDLDSQTTMDKANVVLKVTQAMSFYTTSAMQHVMPREHYLRLLVAPVLSLSEADVKSVMDEIPKDIAAMGALMPEQRDRSGENVRGRTEKPKVTRDGQPVGPVGNAKVLSRLRRSVSENGLTTEEVTALEEVITEFKKTLRRVA